MTTQKGINDLAYKIIGCAIEVHRELGPGLLESIYQKCMEEELKNRNLSFQSQINIPIKYKTITLDCDLRLDILVEDLIIIELKAVETLLPLFHAQLLTYMKLLKKPKGLLINFNSDNIVNNTVSLVNQHFNEYL
ncbi:MAG: GxxExxY protein [Chitinophagales bacterium]|nr:GxxExxY protein [Chitinophagales bacterium]HMV14030.1 GxxExxY protein [Chitinophagales bacterium]HMW12691.1 GxxExxY protein [Chitinophagales bacterium]HMX60272.1 GxxExxY protein [Chitinophagales bacterium]HMY23020.1 GxxExxY protein [Chitinophagales bacterium]